MQRFEHLLAHVLGVDLKVAPWRQRFTRPVRALASRIACSCANAFGAVRRATRRRGRPAAALPVVAAGLVRPRPASNARRLNAIFLSDVHLGSRGSQASLVLDFLRHHDAPTIYLVGDIIDGWRLTSTWHWPKAHDDVVKAIVAKGRAGARLVYLPGNHDEFMRDHYGTPFAGVEVVEEIVHEAVDGRRYLVLHGDKFDVVVAHARWLALLGDWAYFTTLRLNIQVNRVRRLFGLQYWSLSAWAKMKVKKAVNFIGAFEDALAGEARRAQCDGVICGHIHHATMRDIGGVAYLNCGDFVESCTALVETESGAFEIVRWAVPGSDMRPAERAQTVVKQAA